MALEMMGSGHTGSGGLGSDRAWQKQEVAVQADSLRFLRSDCIC